MKIKRLIGLICTAIAGIGMTFIVLGFIYMNEQPTWIGAGVITFAMTIGIGIKLLFSGEKNVV